MRYHDNLFERSIITVIYFTYVINKSIRFGFTMIISGIKIIAFFNYELIIWKHIMRRI